MGAFVCIQCTTGDDEVSFDTAKDLFLHQKGGHKNRPPKQELPPSPPKGPSATEKGQAPAATTPETKPVPEVVNSSHLKPLELTYKWVGFHKVCSTEPRTLVMRVGENWWAIAYCVNCDAKIAEMQVAKLPAYKLPVEERVFEKNVKPKKK